MSRFPDPEVDRAIRAARQRQAQATSLAYHNGAHRNKLALERALEALRKISLGHPCDLPDRIAALAIEDVETIRAGGTPPRRDVSY